MKVNSLADVLNTLFTVKIGTVIFVHPLVYAEDEYNALLSLYNDRRKFLLDPANRYNLLSKQKLNELPPIVKELDKVSLSPLTFLGIPRIGYDGEADEWFSNNWTRRDYIELIIGKVNTVYWSKKVLDEFAFGSYVLFLYRQVERSKRAGLGPISRTYDLPSFVTPQLVPLRIAKTAFTSKRRLTKLENLIKRNLNKKLTSQTIMGLLKIFKEEWELVEPSLRERIRHGYIPILNEDDAVFDTNKSLNAKVAYEHAVYHLYAIMHHIVFWSKYKFPLQLLEMEVSGV